MIPHVITPHQARIAEAYWGTSWTFLNASQVQEALDWHYYRVYYRRVFLTPKRE